MPVQGVANNGLNAQQQSLFSGDSTQSLQSDQTSNSDNSAGNVKQQFQVGVLKSSLETKQQNTLQLINSSFGIGQNIDTFA